MVQACLAQASSSRTGLPCGREKDELEDPDPIAAFDEICLDFKVVHSRLLARDTHMVALHRRRRSERYGRTQHRLRQNCALHLGSLFRQGGRRGWQRRSHKWR